MRIREIALRRLLDDLEVVLAAGLREDARRAGVREATARVLLSLEPDEESPMGEVAVHLGRDPSTTTRFVDRAVAQGYVIRRTGRDRRRRLVGLTPEGIAVRETLLTARRARAMALPEAVGSRTGLNEDQLAWFLDAVLLALSRPVSD